MNVERSASTVAVDADNPWPGLASFTEENSGFFFGRQKETTELVRLIRRNVLTVLFGQSGLGKSSLLQAGAFPALREADYFPLYVRLDHDPAAPPLADQVKAALGAAFAAGGVDATAPGANESLWEYFHRKDVDHWSAKNRLLTPVLAFDQFEEIFTLGNADEARRTRARVFLTELADLVQHRVPPALRERFETGELQNEHFHFDKASCHIVLSLREDFLPNLEGLKQEMRSVMRGRMRVQRLNGLQALEIVQRPAPHLLAEGVAERIVEFVAGARGGSAERLAEFEVEPALLSVICRELNERRKAAGQAQITADLVTGNRREILTDFYERSVADLPPDMRTFVEDHLLTKSGFRDNLALETALEFPGVTKPLIDTLVSRRLLRLEDRLGVQRVELTHDVLAEVIRGSRDSRQQQLAIEKERQRERLTRRRMWLARTIAAGLLVGFLGVSWIAWRAVRAEREQVNLRATAESLRQQAQEHEMAARRKAYASDMIALRHALDANNLGRARELLNRQRPQAGQTDLRGWEWRYLWQFSQSDAAFVLRPENDNTTLSIAGSHDGSWVAVGSLYGGALSLFKLATREEIRLSMGSGPVRVAFSPRESLLAIGLSTGIPESAWGNDRVGSALLRSPRRSIQLLDVNTQQVRREFPIEGACQGIVFSADGESFAVREMGAQNQISIWSVGDGRRIAAWPAGSVSIGYSTAFAVTSNLETAAISSGFNGDSIDVIDLKTGRRRWSVPAGDNYVTALALSPDGKILASAAGFSQQTVRLWDAQDGHEIGVLAGHNGWVGEIIFLADGQHVVTASADQTLRLWDLTTRNTVRIFRGHKIEAWRVALLPDQRTLVSGCKYGSAYMWDLSAPPPEPATGKIENIPPLFWSFATGGTSIITVSYEGRVQQKHGRNFEFDGFLLQIGTVAAVAVHPTLPLFAADAGGKIQIWDWERRIMVREIAPGLEGRVVFPSEAFSAEGSSIRIVVTTSAKVSFRAWDLKSGSELRVRDVTLPEPHLAIARRAVSGDGLQVAVAIADSGVHIDSRTGRVTRLATTSWPEPAPQSSFSPDGTLVALASRRGYARLFNSPSMTEVATLRGFLFGVHSSTFSPDGQRIAVGSTAAEGISVWDVESHERLLTLPTVVGSLVSLAFSPDGNTLAGENQNTLFFWRAPTWAGIEAAERKDTGKASQ